MTLIDLRGFSHLGKEYKVYAQSADYRTISTFLHRNQHQITPQSAPDYTAISTRLYHNQVAMLWHTSYPIADKVCSQPVYLMPIPRKSLKER